MLGIRSEEEADLTERTRRGGKTRPSALRLRPEGRHGAWRCRCPRSRGRRGGWVRIPAERSQFHKDASTSLSAASAKDNGATRGERAGLALRKRSQFGPQKKQQPSPRRARRSRRTRRRLMVFVPFVTCPSWWAFSDVPIPQNEPGLDRGANGKG